MAAREAAKPPVARKPSRVQQVTAQKASELLNQVSSKVTASSEAMLQKLWEKKQESDDEEEEAYDETKAFVVTFTSREPLGLELLETGCTLVVKRVVAGGQAEGDGRVAAGHALLRIGDVEVSSMRGFEAAVMQQEEREYSATFAPAQERDESQSRRRLERYEAALEEERRTAEDQDQEIAALKAEKAELEQSLKSERSTHRAEKAALRAQLEETKDAVQRQSSSSNALLEEAAKSAAEAAKRHRDRERDLESALDRHTEPTVSNNDEDELAAARAALEQHRRDGSQRLAAVRREERQSASVAVAESQRELQEARLDLEREKARHTETEDKAQVKIARLLQEAATKQPPGDDEKLLAAERRAADATDRALKRGAQCDSIAAEKAALVSRLRAATERIARLESRAFTEFQRDQRPPDIQEDHFVPASRSPRNVTRRTKPPRHASSNVATAYSLQAPLADRWGWVGSIASSTGDNACCSLVVATLEAFDELTLAVNMLTRPSSVRLPCALYLIILHAWSFALITNRMYNLEHDNPNVDSPGRQAASLKLRGSGNFKAI